MMTLRHPLSGCALRGLLVLFMATLAPASHAYQWDDFAMISSTVGNTAGRLCTGLGAADIGCPANAPFFDLTNGRIGIGTAAPSSTLHVQAQSDVPTTGLTLGSSTGLTSTRLEVYPIGDHSTAVRFRSEGVMDFRTPSDVIIRIVGGTRNVGINTTNPSATLHVSGTLRIASGGEACDANRTGAIRYSGSDFQFCRNGTAWESLASVANSAAPDRIVSGTTTLVVVSNTGFISLTQGGSNTGWFDPQQGLVTLGISTTGNISTRRLFVSLNTPSQTLAYLRDNTSAVDLTINGVGNHLRLMGGAGDRLVLGTQNTEQLIFAGPEDGNQNFISFRPSGTLAMHMVSTGLVGIGTSSPREALQVAGNVSIRGDGNFYGMNVYWDGVTSTWRAIRGDRHAAYIRMGTSNVGQAGDLQFGTSSLPASGVDNEPIGISHRLVIRRAGDIRTEQGMMVGAVDVTPTTRLHVSGTLRIANGGEACDGSRMGAIRYSGGDFQFCRNGTTWENLASIAGSVTTDRIVSGTSNVVAQSGGSVTISTNGAARMVVGNSGQIGIGTDNPAVTLDVSGVLKVAGTGNEGCGPGTYGSIRRNPTTGRLQVCRELN
jgi:hypothetical protein